MYSPRRSYGSPPPELSNNPFIDNPSNPLTRYPDITGGDLPGSQPQPYTTWLSPNTGPSSSSLSPTPSGYVGQQQMGMNGAGGYGPSQIPQQNTWGIPPSTTGYPSSPMGSGFMSPPVQSQPTGMPFQPSSAFGQQLQGAMGGGYGGMPQQQQQQQQQQYSGYPTQYGQMGYGQPPQQQQPQNAYLPEFDPLANSSSGPTNSQAQTQGNSQYQTAHPRDFIRQHKAELEAWDPYYWKQALNAFDSLKEAWGARKRDIEARVRSYGGAGLFSGGGYGGMYGGQGQEVARLEQLAKEASSNFDSVAASTFQMQEVFAGYRQSGDMASKRRVRECVNAALASLPDWPPQYL